VTLPRVQPIIPTWRKEPFDDPEWLFEFKYDGFRGLCYHEQGRCRFISRNGNVLSRFEALGDQVAAALDVDEAVIDGEVIEADETGRPQFYELLRGTRTPAKSLSTSSGSTVPTCDLCRSPSVERASRVLFRRGRRLFPRRYVSRAGGAN
jgi:ATP-dependent DNA ligase